MGKPKEWRSYFQGLVNEDRQKTFTDAAIGKELRNLRGKPVAPKVIVAIGAEHGEVAPQAGRCRFQDFVGSLAGIAPNTLSAWLKSPEADCIVEREFYDQHPPRAEYVLTEDG